MNSSSTTTNDSTSMESILTEINSFIIIVTIIFGIIYKLFKCYTDDDEGKNCKISCFNCNDIENVTPPVSTTCDICNNPLEMNSESCSTCYSQTTLVVE